MGKITKNIKKNHVVVHGWMVQELNLGGNELLAFSLIYGFCQDQQSEFTGSIDYVGTWLNCSRPTAIKTMSKLVDKECILKIQLITNGVTFNRYKVNFQKIENFTSSKDSLLGVKKINKGSKDSLLGGSKKTLLGGSKESLPNNIIDNINNNNKEKGSSFFSLIESKRGKSEIIDFEIFKAKFEAKQEAIIISERKNNKNFKVQEFDKILKRFFVEKTMITFESQNHFFSSLSLFVKNSIKDAPVVATQEPKYGYR